MDVYTWNYNMIPRYSCLLLILAASLSCVLAQEQMLSPEDLLARADAQFESGKYIQAGQLYGAFVETYPEHAEAARAAFQQAESASRDTSLQPRQRHSRAVEIYEVAVENYADSPLAPAAYYSFAQSYLKLGFVQDAIVQLRLARQSYPTAENAREILLLLADSYYYLDDFEQSISYYRVFLDTYPQDDLLGEVLLKYAESLSMHEEHSQALTVFARLQQTFPTMLAARPELLYLRARSLMAAGQHAAAEEQLNALRQLPVENYLQSYVVFQLATVESALAERLQGEQQEVKLRSAMENFYTVYNESGEANLETAAILEVVRIGDELKIDISEYYGLPSVDSLLMNSHQRTIDVDAKALILTRLAQHHRRNNRVIKALNYYSSVINRYADTEISQQTLSEYNRFVRELMASALEVDDYDLYLNLYLGYGKSLELDVDEQYTLAIAYLRVGLSDEAESIFEELLAIGLPEERTRQIVVERMKYHFTQQNFEEARRQAYRILRMNPTERERELALYYEQEVYFAQRDLEFLQALYFDHPEKRGTPLLDISILTKLSRLQALEEEFGLAETYTGRIFQNFDINSLNEPLLFPIIKSAWLIRADALYMTNQFAAAADAYQRYLFYADAKDSLAWALLQLAKSLEKIGRIEFAIQTLERFMENYSEHTLAAEAQHVRDRIQP